MRKRAEEMVAKRMVEEQAKLKEQTESEVARRVQDARKHMETMMKEEFQKKTKEQEEEIARLKVQCVQVHCVMATTYVVCGALGLNGMYRFVIPIVRQRHDVVYLRISLSTSCLTTQGLNNFQ